MFSINNYPKKTRSITCAAVTLILVSFSPLSALAADCSGFSNRACSVGSARSSGTTDFEYLSVDIAEAIEKCEESHAPNLALIMDMFRDALAACRAGAASNECSQPIIGLDPCAEKDCSEAVSCYGFFRENGRLVECKIDPKTGSAAADERQSSCQGTKVHSFGYFECEAYSATSLPTVDCPGVDGTNQATQVSTPRV